MPLRRTRHLDDRETLPQLLASGSGQQVRKSLEENDQIKSLPDAKNATAAADTTRMTKPPLPRKPSLEETTKKELSATAGDGGAAKISPSAQPSPAVERPVAMGE